MWPIMLDTDSDGWCKWIFAAIFNSYLKVKVKLKLNLKDEEPINRQEAQLLTQVIVRVNSQRYS